MGYCIMQKKVVVTGYALMKLGKLYKARKSIHSQSRLLKRGRENKFPCWCSNNAKTRSPPLIINRN